MCERIYNWLKKEYGDLVIITPTEINELLKDDRTIKAWKKEKEVFPKLELDQFVFDFIENIIINNNNLLV